MVWVGESHSLADLAKPNEGGTTAQSIPLGSYKPLKHVHGTSPSVILGGTTFEARELISIALDARRARHVVSSLPGSF